VLGVALEVIDQFVERLLLSGFFESGPA